MLTELQCRHAKPADKPYKLTDGQGMFLLVQPNGSRWWRLAYRIAGKQKSMSLGVYPATGLLDARKAREAARQTIRLGIDPLAARVADTGGATFEEVAREHHRHWQEGKNPAHVLRVWNRLLADAMPVIGHRPVDKITPVEVLGMIRKVEERGALDVSRRLKQKCSEVFCYAIATGRTTLDPCASISRAMKPKPRVRHMAMVGPRGLGPLARSVFQYEGDPHVVGALRFTLLTAVRTSETRLARWEEFEPGLWRIPARRMKMAREHLVPLSRQATEVLAALPRVGEFVFPGRGGYGVISQTAMLMALRRSGWEGQQTVHGFRRLFSTVLNEEGWNRDWIEMALAHTDGDVRGAYNAALYLEGRRSMLQRWADLVCPDVEALFG